MTPPVSEPALDVEVLTEAVRLAFGPALLRLRPTERGADVAPHSAGLHTRAAEQAWCLCLASHVAAVVARHYQDQLRSQAVPPMGRSWRPRSRRQR